MPGSDEGVAVLIALSLDVELRTMVHYDPFLDSIPC